MQKSTYLQDSLRNPFINWKNPRVFHHEFKNVDLMRYRQHLGDISREEVAEANSITGAKWALSKGSQPAQIKASPNYLWGIFGFCAATAVYGKFMKGYAIVWLWMPFAIYGAFSLKARSNPDPQIVENAYRYIIAKRSATCVHDKNKQEMEEFFNENKNEASKV